MKAKLLTLSIASALALGTSAVLYAGEHGGPHGPGGPEHGFSLEHVAKELDLTAQQQAQVAPIVEQVKPQMKAIHEEAMAKSRAVMETASAQIRPLLTPEQQAKLDKLQAAHEKMHEAMKELHDARTE